MDAVLLVYFLHRTKICIKLKVLNNYIIVRYQFVKLNKYLLILSLLNYIQIIISMNLRFKSSSNNISWYLPSYIKEKTKN